MTLDNARWYSTTKNDLWTHLGIIAIAVVLITPGLVDRGEVGGIGTTICLAGVAATVALAVLARVFARRRAPDDVAPRLTLRQWIAERGILYALSQAPVVAIYSGFFFRVVPFGAAVIGVVIAFFLLVVWTSYRKSRSTNPDEPVHHLHRYALYALVPCVLFSVARIPTHMELGFAYWHPWYDFGSDLTGLAPHHYPSLLAGALLYTLDGLVLTIGYYILFQRRSLTNAILYICLYISSIYCFTFPAYGRIGMPSPPAWHAVVYWAHLVMAIGAWAMPHFYRRVWPRLRRLGRTAAVSVIGAVLVAPYGYAAFQAAELQWPKQERIDRELFDRTLIAAPDTVAVTTEAGDARYELTMTIGPRSYKNWVNRTRVLDVVDLSIAARLLDRGRPVAWCSGHASELERVNEAGFDPDFVDRVRAADYAKVPVRCFGPADVAARLGADDQLTIEWQADTKLIGDRESRQRVFRGVATATVATQRVVASLSSH